MAESDKARHSREAEFFDGFYAENATTYDPRVLERYRRLSARGLYSKEYRIAQVGDLTGRRVADIGCGAGENAVLLALLGAHVTGLDVSPVAVEKAKALAASAGVSDRVDVRVQSFEDFEAGEGAFDVVWVDAFLHHMLPVLDATMVSLVKLLKPGGLMVIAEPIRLSGLARSIRPLVPIPVDATPDERPLQDEELALIGRHLEIVATRRFNGVARVGLRALVAKGYEEAAGWRRALCDASAYADRVLLSLPGLGRFLAGGIAVVARKRP